MNINEKSIKINERLISINEKPKQITGHQWQHLKKQGTTNKILLPNLKALE
jgi:hypothetical protein